MLVPPGMVLPMMESFRGWAGEGRGGVERGGGRGSHVEVQRIRNKGQNKPLLDYSLLTSIAALSLLTFLS